MSKDSGFRREGGQASDLCIICLAVQSPIDIPDELPGVGLESLIRGIPLVLGGGCPLY